MWGSLMNLGMGAGMGNAAQAGGMMNGAASASKPMSGMGGMMDMLPGLMGMMGGGGQQQQQPQAPQMLMPYQINPSVLQLVQQLMAARQQRGM